MKNRHERFHAFISPEPNTGCWLWTGTGRKDHAQFQWARNQPMMANRASWIINRGPIPEGSLICHHCDNGWCVNPDHLYVGDFKTNRRDMLSRKRWSHPYGRRLHCSKGHEYAVLGLYVAADGSRVCRECHRLAMRRHRERKKGTRT